MQQDLKSVLKERSIGTVRGRVGHSRICGVPSERGEEDAFFPRVAPWAGMRPPLWGWGRHWRRRGVHAPKGHRIPAPGIARGMQHELKSVLKERSIGTARARVSSRSQTGAIAEFGNASLRETAVSPPRLRSKRGAHPPRQVRPRHRTGVTSGKWWYTTSARHPCPRSFPPLSTPAGCRSLAPGGAKRNPGITRPPKKTCPEGAPHPSPEAQYNPRTKPGALSPGVRARRTSQPAPPGCRRSGRGLRHTGGPV